MEALLSLTFVGTSPLLMKMKSGATGMFWKSFFRALMRVLGFFFFSFFLFSSFESKFLIFKPNFRVSSRYFQVLSQRFRVSRRHFQVSSQIFKYSVKVSKFQVKILLFESITYFKIPSRMFTFIRVKISKFRI